MKVLKILFSFRGEITRKQWWIWHTAAFGIILWIWFPVTFVSVFAFGDRPDPPAIAGPIILASFLMIIVSGLWISLAINIKRLRNRGRKWLGMTLILILTPFLYAFWGSMPGIPFIFLTPSEILSTHHDYLLNLAFCLILALWPIMELGILKGKNS